ncbi:hypothetical protein L210DRAFT_800531, partial [Boletus edulis BED1]
LGATRMPAWLLAKLGHYPSMQDYEVATVEECNTYWKEDAEEHTNEQTMSSS